MSTVIDYILVRINQIDVVDFVAVTEMLPMCWFKAY